MLRLMCGIAGIAGGAPPDPALLERMAATMVHRGPDGQGIWNDETVGLAFRRLAIIDLHERSSQPMHFERWHLVFNGEIYNYRELCEELTGLGHRFVTEGDTEVLLHAWAQWGEGALERVNGMFAFAVWDDSERCLTLARDPFGEKPLYYRRAGERLTFASDIPAILCEPGASAVPRTSVLGPYLVSGDIPDVGESFFAEIDVVPAAHVLRWHAGAIELDRYWTPALTTPTLAPRRYEDAVAALRELLSDSVRLRLRSDVPVGTSLSGGVDSSAIVALAAEIAGDHTRHAFTARFLGFERDEWRYAETVARAAGVVEHHSVEPTVDGLLDDLDALIVAQQEPVGSSSIYAQWCVMRSARLAGVVVLLDGQGGDELFGGYPGMGGYALRSGRPRELVAALGRSLASELGRSLAVDYLPRSFARAYRRRTASPYAAGELVLAEAMREPGYLPWMRTADPLRRELLLQCFVTSLPQLLRYADRSSMAHSREVRLPLLDRRVAEFALSLRAEFAYKPGMTKRILRDAVRGLVPETVLARGDKVGFETPQARWFNIPRAQARIAECLLDDRARTRGLYDLDAVELDVRAGRWRDPGAIWRALNLERWLCLFEGGSEPESTRLSPDRESAG
jgi:asparagine synthase (glutamine-hydrolysing)